MIIDLIVRRFYKEKNEIQKSETGTKSKISKIMNNYENEKHLFIHKDVLQKYDV